MTHAARKDERLLADNRKAGHDFHLLEQFEAGVALIGTEVKAIREGRVQPARQLLQARGRRGLPARRPHRSIQPRRVRGRTIPCGRASSCCIASELNKLLGKTTEKGLTIVPLRMYFKNGRVKVVIALAKGKKTFDKRETIKRREADRETRAAASAHVRNKRS